ncbi:MAG: hypothetical protein LBT37_05945 [Lactobacillaceae bacterium]|jgi:hypothetical protein|nr:hypothetical protein [Lactobacillaceae bacterium]
MNNSIQESFTKSNTHRKNLILHDPTKLISIYGETIAKLLSQEIVAKELEHATNE